MTDARGEDPDGAARPKGASHPRHRAGPIGETLNTVEGYEQGEWNHLDFGELSPEELADAYFRAMRWSVDVMKELGLY